MKTTPFIFLLFLSKLGIAQDSEFDLKKITSQLNSIEKSEIKGACDCSDGMAKIATILVETTNGFSSRKEVLRDIYAAEVVRLTNIKMEEIVSKCKELEINDPDIVDCPSFQTLKEMSFILNEKF